MSQLDSMGHVLLKHEVGPAEEKIKAVTQARER